jgi:hypothetical protein
MSAANKPIDMKGNPGIPQHKRLAVGDKLVGDKLPQPQPKAPKTKA